MNKSRLIIVYLLIILAAGFATVLKVLPYAVNHYDFLIGFDSGKYTYDLIYKTSTTPQNIDLWVEPGFNTLLSSLNSIINLDPRLYFKFILPGFISLYFCLFAFLFSRKLTGSIIAGVFSAFYIATSSIFLNSTFDSFYRQLYATLIFFGFLYCINLIYLHKLHNMKYYIMIAILGAGIIFSHRGISVLYAIALTVLFYLLFRDKRYIELKYTILSFIGTLLFSSPYWLFIAATNIVIIKDSIVLSTKGNTGGERVINSLNRSDNQILGYIKSVSVSFLPITGVLYTFIKDKKNLVMLFTLIMVLYIFIKAVFSNRFMINLEFLFAILAGVMFKLLISKYNRVIVTLFFVLIIIFNFLTSLDISSQKKPYVPNGLSSIDWIKQHISPSDSIIIAPDALSTIFTTMGYRASTYELPLKGDTQITNTERMLAYGYNNYDVFKSNFKRFHYAYIAFGEWNTQYPFTRTGLLVPMDKWDKSPIAQRVYIGDPYITRIYQIDLTKK